MTLNKNNPLQQQMLKAGCSEMEVLEYYKDLHERSLIIPQDSEASKMGFRFHAKEFERYNNLIIKLKLAIKDENE